MTGLQQILYIAIIFEPDWYCCCAVLQKWVERAKPPKWLWRTIAAVVLGGQVATRILKGSSLAQPLLHPSR